MKIIFLVLTLGTFSCATLSTRHVLTNRELAELLGHVEPWPDARPAPSTNYSKAGWQRLISVAGIIQKSEPRSVEQALREYQKSYAVDYLRPPPRFVSDSQVLEYNKAQKATFDRELQNDGKLLLLMRVVFELPERMHWLNWRRVFGGWVTWEGKSWEGTDRNADGTINYAWPIAWNDGDPRLVQGCKGLIGVDPRYRAAEEYEYFQKKYPMRNLESFSKRKRATPPLITSPPRS